MEGSVEGSVEGSTSYLPTELAYSLLFRNSGNSADRINNTNYYQTFLSGAYTTLTTNQLT